MSVIAKLFDPRGWLGPIVILAKLLMQQLWEAKLDCDEAVPVKIQVKWKLFCDHLHRIHSLRIPRWTGVSLESRIQLKASATHPNYLLIWSLQPFTGLGLR